MNDIVQRLRTEPAKTQRGLEIMDEAADEIERLRQQLAELQAKYDAREQECRTAFGKEMELRKQLAECERDAYDLWMMLDNIDTADDIAKGDEKLYRAMVRRENAKRFDDRFKWVMNYIDDLAKLGADKTGGK